MSDATRTTMKKQQFAKRGARLGQHFLTGAWAATKLAAAIKVQPDETILEIGPGTGALTKKLLETDARVIAVEKDASLVVRLRDMFANEIADGRFTLVHDDIRAITPQRLHLSSYVVAANIPYYITGEIIRTFLTAHPQPRAMALLVQKEVAERIMAKDGKESLLSISVKAYGRPRIVAKVARGNFSPPPSIDSAILCIDDISRAFFLRLKEERFFEIVRAGFASKRKLVARNIQTRFGLAPNVPPGTRAEQLTLDEWAAIVRQIEATDH